MDELVNRISETPWSVGLRESLFVWPMLEAAHVLTLMLFVGSIMMVDLRLLGWAFTRVPVSQFDRRILPWAIGGFALMVITGVILVYAKPLVYYYSVFFRAKMVLLVLGLANILWFHFRVQKNQADWDHAERLPGAVRRAGFVSLTVWIAIVVLGRMIAYDFLDCGKLEPGGLLAGFASCPAPSNTLAEAI